MASKKARAPSPVSAAIASASFEPVSGPVAMIVGWSGSASTRSRTTVMFGCCSIARVTSAAKPSRSTASAEPAGTRWLSAARMISEPSARISWWSSPTALFSASSRAEAVRADHLGEAVAFVRWRPVAAAAHFAEPYAQARLGELPGGFGPGEAAADDVDVEGHRGAVTAASEPLSSAHAECMFFSPPRHRPFREQLCDRRADAGTLREYALVGRVRRASGSTDRSGASTRPATSLAGTMASCNIMRPTGREPPARKRPPGDRTPQGPEVAPSVCLTGKAGI